MVAEWRASSNDVEKRQIEHLGERDDLDVLWVGSEQAAATKTQIEAIDAKYPPPAE
jgi:hypothetical protein